jgi:hypothetical protein
MHMYRRSREELPVYCKRRQFPFQPTLGGMLSLPTLCKKYSTAEVPWSNRSQAGRNQTALPFASLQISSQRALTRDSRHGAADTDTRRGAKAHPKPCTLSTRMPKPSKITQRGERERQVEVGPIMRETSSVSLMRRGSIEGRVRRSSIA